MASEKIEHTPPDEIWATPTRVGYDSPDWTIGAFYDEYGAAGLGTKYVRHDIASCTLDALLEARRYVEYLAGGDRTFVGKGMPADCLRLIDAAIAKATGAS